VIAITACGDAVMQTHYSDQNFAAFGTAADAARSGSTPRSMTKAWLAVAIAAYVAGARMLGAALCAEHICDVSDHGEDWLRVRSDAAADYPSARRCPECSQVFARVTT
jgi:hypothetical protein